MAYRIHRDLFRTTLAVACMCLGIFLHWMPSCAGAEVNAPLKGGKSSRGLVGQTQFPWDIQADRLTYDQNRNVYLAEGHVRIKSEDRSVEAEWAEVDAQNHRAEFRGNVSLVYGRDWLQGDHVFWNLDEETGWVDGGMAYFAESHFYVQGKYIAKTGPTQYELREGSITSCDPSNSDWKIRYDKMRVNLEGIAWANGASFWVREIPLLYAPLVALPVEQHRQSGFLIPWVGYSTLNGADMELPFYWAIRQDMDATVYSRYMEKRGAMVGLEYRIANDKFGTGVWLVNYIHDEADKAFLADKGFPLETRDRYWVRSRHSFELPGDIEGRLDLDMASDRNFLNEFTKGSSSYDYSNRLFREMTGRGILNDKTILSRESSLYLDQRRESSLLSLDVRYWDQLDTSLEDTTVQRLPVLSYSIIPSWIGDTPLYYTLQSSAANYWVEKGNRGGRLDFYPRAYYPLHWNNYLDVEPSVGIRGTAYAVDWEKESHNEAQGRFLSDIRLDMSNRFNRVYQFGFGDTVALQHAVRPQIVYEYVPDVIRDWTPHFDRLDNNQARHDVRYGFTSFLTSKQVRKDVEGNSTTSYLELGRVEISQAYHFERMPRDVDDLGLVSPAEEGFSDFSLRVDLTPQRYMTVSYETDISPVNGSPTQQDVYLTLDSGRGHLFRLDYQYRKDTVIDELIAQFNVRVLPNIYLSTYHDYSVIQKSLFSQGYGLRYQQGCWAIGIVYEKEDRDERVALTLNLLGLGNFGGGFSLGGPGSTPLSRPQ